MMSLYYSYEPQFGSMMNSAVELCFDVHVTLKCDMAVTLSGKGLVFIYAPACVTTLDTNHCNLTTEYHFYITISLRHCAGQILR